MHIRTSSTATRYGVGVTWGLRGGLTGAGEVVGARLDEGGEGGGVSNGGWGKATSPRHFSAPRGGNPSVLDANYPPNKLLAGGPLGGAGGGGGALEGGFREGANWGGFRKGGGGGGVWEGRLGGGGSGRVGGEGGTGSP